ncbi:MAG: hypothetical protein ACLQGP_10515 [Isosphaeraceae bacterium]
MQSLRLLLAFVITMMLIDSWTDRAEATPAQPEPAAAVGGASIASPAGESMAPR